MTRLFFLAGVAFGALLLLVTTGCVGQPGESAAAEPLRTPAPLEDEEIVAWAEQLEKDVAAGNFDLFGKIDLRALLERATESSADAQVLREEFIAGTLEQTQAEQGLLFFLLKKVEGEAHTYRFLHLKQVAGARRAIFRVFDAEGKLNYHGFVLARRAGEVKVVDIFTASAGECVSDTVRRTFLPRLKDAKRDWFESVLGSSSDYVTRLDDLVNICGQVQYLEFADALKTYASLPETLQQEKLVMQGRIAATQALEDPAYDEAVTAFLAQHGNDASAALVLLEASLQREDYAGTLEAADDLDRIAGGDPYLNTIRAQAHAALDDATTARILLRRAIDEDPTLRQAYWSLLSLAVQQGDHAETLQMLRALSTQFDLQFGDLALMPEYANFVTSPEYQQWLAFQSGQ